MSKISNIEELKTVIERRIEELDNVPCKYLNEAGIAAIEAYRNTLWHLGFHKKITSLYADEQLRDLLNIKDRNPEYYRILNMIIKKIEELYKKEGDIE